jgi:flagellar biosynthetic protein FliR
MLEIIASNLDMTVEKVELFSLALVRILSMIYVMPFLATGSVIPTTAKIGLSFFLALIAYPQLPLAGFVIGNSPIFFVTLVVEQVLIGLIIGFTCTYIFHFVSVGGSLISRDIGISMGGSTDPIQDQPGDEMSVFLLLIFSLVFLVKGYHYYFIQVLMDSFQMIPLGHFNWDFLPIARVFCIMSAAALVTGIKLAAPCMIALMMMTLGMGLTARVMPQMNVWIVAVPLKVVLGVVILWETFPLLTMLFDENFKQVLEGLSYLMRHGAVHG